MEGKGKSGEAPGQNKTYQITNPATGEMKTVTQRQWREEKLGKAGWQKPTDMPDEDTTTPPDAPVIE